MIIIRLLIIEHRVNSEAIISDHLEDRNDRSNTAIGQWKPLLHNGNMCTWHYVTMYLFIPQESPVVYTQ